MDAAQLEAVVLRMAEDVALLAARADLLVFKPAEAAARISLSLSALKTEIREGKITPCPLGKRWGVSREELERYSRERLESMRRVVAPAARARRARRTATPVTGKTGAEQVRAALRARP